MKKSLPTVVIVGRPNVGKSTFFNRLVGKRIAVVEDSPGITRDRLYAEVTWNRNRFQVVDTGGIVFQDSDPMEEQIKVQAEVALAEADVVIFLADVMDGVHPDDRDLANHLRGITKPVLVVVNKADNFDREDYANEFYSLGLGHVFPVSSLHGSGVAEVLDEVITHIPILPDDFEEKEEVRLAIVGRPNVGKSSLVNAFTGEQRMIVSNIAGTTRDAIDTELVHEGETFRLIDT
ncbi:MAG: ribosome biogenesis GTPase Der, partial [Armatimonadota bacterium]